MRVIDIIHKKREGGAHTDEEISFLVGSYAQGKTPDYQMSAWLMAVLWRGLSAGETFALTTAMVASGDTLDLTGLTGPFLDKHSTGGVGDKTTLAVVPILASAGVQMPKMSGRGLGHTGGTLDKLESLGGTRVALTADEIREQVHRVGACLCAQTDRLVPADRKMYALRDATDTVGSLPLIAASIMSKKIAGSCPSILLDVKVGGGAFMKSLPDARALAHLMIAIGEAAGRRVAAVLSDMNMPLGESVGNRIEVREVARLLQKNPGTDARLKSLVLTLAGAGFLLAGRVGTVAEGEALASAQIVSGAAFTKLHEIIAYQGGDTDYLTDDTKPPVARVQWDVTALQGGYVQRLDAEAIGLAVMRLGAGRETKEDRINPTAGVILHRTVGRLVAQGDTVATLYTDKEAAARSVGPLVWDAFLLGPAPPDPPPVIYETIGLNT